MDGSNITAQTQLRQIVERIEQLRAEQADLKEAEKEVFAEAKAMGFMTRPVRSLIKLRAMDPDKRAEEEAVLEMYKDAVGMR